MDEWGLAESIADAAGEEDDLAVTHPLADAEPPW